MILNAERLVGVFESIEKNMLFQSSMLESIYNIQVDGMERGRQARIEEDAARREEREDRIRQEELQPEPKKTTEKSDSIVEEVAVGNIIADLLEGKFFTSLTNFASSVGKYLAMGAALVLGTGVIEGLTGFDIDGLAGKLLTGDLGWGDLGDLAASLPAEIISFILKGPIGALRAAVAGSLIDTVEEFSGIDLPEGAETALAALIGVGAGPVTRGLIWKALRLLTLTPLGRIATVVAGAIVLLGPALEKLQEVFGTTIDDELKATEEAMARGADAAELRGIQEGLNQRFSMPGYSEPLTAEQQSALGNTQTNLADSTIELDRAIVANANAPLQERLNSIGNILEYDLRNSSTPEEKTAAYNRAFAAIENTGYSYGITEEEGPDSFANRYFDGDKSELSQAYQRYRPATVVPQSLIEDTSAESRFFGISAPMIGESPRLMTIANRRERTLTEGASVTNINYAPQIVNNTPVVNTTNVSAAAGGSSGSVIMTPGPQNRSLFGIGRMA